MLLFKNKTKLNSLQEKSSESDIQDSPSRRAGLKHHHPMVTLSIAASSGPYSQHTHTDFPNCCPVSQSLILVKDQQTLEENLWHTRPNLNKQKESRDNMGAEGTLNKERKSTSDPNDVFIKQIQDMEGKKEFKKTFRKLKIQYLELKYLV